VRNEVNVNEVLDSLIEDLMKPLGLAGFQYCCGVRDKASSTKEQKQLSYELNRRIDQCIIILKLIKQININEVNFLKETIKFKNDMYKLRNNSSEIDFNSDCRIILAEAFYWNAFKVTKIICAKNRKSIDKKSFKLPGIDREFEFDEVNRIRNKFIEHPEVPGHGWRQSLTQGLIFNSGGDANDEDKGLYINARIWARKALEILNAAIRREPSW